MPHAIRLSPLLITALLATSGCTGTGLADLAPILAAAEQGRGGAEPADGDRPGSGRAEPATTTATPRPAPSGNAAKPAEEVPGAPTFTAFKARVEAAVDDPRMTAKLFVEAMIRHPQDATLSRGMASLLVIEEDLVDDPASPSGRDFAPGRRYIYDQLVPRDYLLREYLAAPEKMGEADLTPHIVIDEEYKATIKGVDEAAGTAKFYIKVFNDKGTRPRPISLERRDGVWKVDEYSSLFVGT